MEPKDRYIRKLEDQLKEWSVKIGQWAARAEHAEERVKQEYARQIQDLRARQDAAQAKWKALKAASEEAWPLLKDGADRAWPDLKTAYEAALAKFK